MRTFGILLVVLLIVPLTLGTPIEWEKRSTEDLTNVNWQNHNGEPPRPQDWDHIMKGTKGKNIPVGGENQQKVRESFEQWYKEKNKIKKIDLGDTNLDSKVELTDKNKLKLDGLEQPDVDPASALKAGKDGSWEVSQGEGKKAAKAKISKSLKGKKVKVGKVNSDTGRTQGSDALEVCVGDCTKGKDGTRVGIPPGDETTSISMDGNKLLIKGKNAYYLDGIKKFKGGETSIAGSADGGKTYTTKGSDGFEVVDPASSTGKVKPPFASYNGKDGSFTFDSKGGLQKSEVSAGYVDKNGKPVVAEMNYHGITQRRLPTTTKNTLTSDYSGKSSLGIGSDIPDVMIKSDRNGWNPKKYSVAANGDVETSYGDYKTQRNGWSYKGAESVKAAVQIQGDDFRFGQSSSVKGSGPAPTGEFHHNRLEQRTATFAAAPLGSTQPDPSTLVPKQQVQQSRSGSGTPRVGGGVTIIGSDPLTRSGGISLGPQPLQIYRNMPDGRTWGHTTSSPAGQPDWFLADPDAPFLGTLPTPEGLARIVIGTPDDLPPQIRQSISPESFSPPTSRQAPVLPIVRGVDMNAQIGSSNVRRDTSGAVDRLYETMIRSRPQGAARWKARSETD